MGTNYYAELPVKSLAEPEVSIKYHLGKASAGWNFLFDGSMLFKNMQMVRSLCPLCTITDEYGNILSYDDFMAVVNKHRHNKSHTMFNSNYMDEDYYEFSEVSFC